jgi:hypothetical protein
MGDSCRHSGEAAGPVAGADGAAAASEVRMRAASIVALLESGKPPQHTRQEVASQSFSSVRICPVHECTTARKAEIDS